MINRDIFCIHCGYNVRGLEESGLCPECGHPIAPSLKRRYLSDADPLWAKQISSGLAGLWISSCVWFVSLFVAGIIASLLDGDNVPPALGFLAGLLGPRPFCAGIWLAANSVPVSVLSLAPLGYHLWSLWQVGAPEPYRDDEIAASDRNTWGTGILLRVVCGAYGAVAVSKIALQALVVDARFGPDPIPLFLLCVIAFDTIYMGALFWRMRSLAVRMSSRGMTLWATFLLVAWVMIGIALAGGLLLEGHPRPVRFFLEVLPLICGILLLLPSLLFKARFYSDWVDALRHHPIWLPEDTDQAARALETMLAQPVKEAAGRRDEEEQKAGGFGTEETSIEDPGDSWNSGDR